jgi:cytochrome c oxidase cbb3-type subunit I/II
MRNPGGTSPGSIMPNYPWLLTQKLDLSPLPARLKALRAVGVPYTDADIAEAIPRVESQQKNIVVNLAVGSVTNAPADREIIALIAYLQRVGSDIKRNQP